MVKLWRLISGAERSNRSKLGQFLHFWIKFKFGSPNQAETSASTLFHDEYSDKHVSHFCWYNRKDQWINQEKKKAYKARVISIKSHEQFYFKNTGTNVSKILSFFCSVFTFIRTEYRKHRTEKTSRCHVCEMSSYTQFVYKVVLSQEIASIGSCLWDVIIYTICM